MTSRPCRLLTVTYTKSNSPTHPFPYRQPPNPEANTDNPYRISVLQTLICPPLDPSGCRERKVLCRHATLNTHNRISKNQPTYTAEDELRIMDGRPSLDMEHFMYREGLSLSDEPLPLGSMWLARKTYEVEKWRFLKRMAEKNGLKHLLPRPGPKEPSYEYVSVFDGEFPSIDRKPCNDF